MVNLMSYLTRISFLVFLDSVSFCSASIVPTTIATFKSDVHHEACTLRYSNFLICNDTNSFYNWLHNTQGKKAKYVETLTIEEWNNETLKTSFLVKFINLKEFVIEGGIITHIVGDFPPLRKLEKIVLSNNRIAQVHSSMFKNLPELVSVDLQNNGLDTIAFPFKHGPKFQSFYLLGNHWDCTKTMKWLLQEEHASLIEDLQQLKCHDKKYIGRPICTVMEFKKFVKEHCRSSELKNCSCTIYYIRKDGIFYAPFYAVNCSYRGFFSLPESLPVNTSVLYMSHNKIEDLSALIDNEMYHTVNDIYLDYNRIKSIDQLWDSVFLFNFRLLSLVGNKISKISPFKVHKALEVNQNVQGIYLSQNPWRCDCEFAAHFQQLINQHEHFILDSLNITCGLDQNDDELYGLPIKYLTFKELCTPEESTLHWLDICNLSMAAIIILILVKLSYDYFHYKKSGRVPWIVTKMP